MFAAAEKVAHVLASLAGLSLWLRKKRSAGFGRFGGRSRDSRSNRFRRVWSLWSFRDLWRFGDNLELNAAGENGALFDGEPARVNVPLDEGGLAEIDAASGLDVAGKVAEDDDIANVDIGANASVRTDGQAALRERDGSFDVSVDVKILIAGKFSADDDRLSDDRRTLCWLHRLFVLPFLPVRRVSVLPELYPSCCREANCLTFGAELTSYVG